MSKVFPGIDRALDAWIRRQALFFVGTAPRADDGHVNVSPKGPIGSLRVIDPKTVVYLDVVGSSAETIAHLRENGRIVVMLCAFAGPPRIVRLHGRGEVLEPTDPAFAALLAAHAFEDAGLPEARRAMVVVRLDRISDSCGYGVPRLDYVGERPQMAAWGRKKLRAGGVAAIAEYQSVKNARSIDGLPALPLDPPKPRKRARPR